MAYALREFEHWWRHYRKLWRGTIVISVANPLLFLIAVGAGLGSLIGPDPARLGGVEYLAFFAPGMLAAASMQNGIVESAFPVSRSQDARRRLPGRRRHTARADRRPVWTHAVHGACGSR